jgi:hypothetical protein
MSVRSEDLGMAFLLCFVSACDLCSWLLRLDWCSFTDARRRAAKFDLDWHPDPKGEHARQVMEIVPLDPDIVNRFSPAIGS